MGLPRRAVATVASMLALAAVACSRSHAASTSNLPPPPPPQLWRVAAVGEGSPGKPIRFCADARLASGFTSITPEIGGHRCVQEGYTHGAPPSQSYKCLIEGQEFGVVTNVSGRYPEDFTAFSAVIDIDSQRSVYSRSLHFRRLGVCPSGWRIGQATDQQGRRAPAAFVTGTNIAYQAQ